MAKKGTYYINSCMWDYNGNGYRIFTAATHPGNRGKGQSGVLRWYKFYDFILPTPGILESK